MLPMKRTLLIASLFLAALACKGPEPGPEPSEPLGQVAPRPPALPWTRAFEEPSVLIADVVRIEGPEGLRDHVAQHQDPDIAEYSIETTTEGLLQLTRAREEGLAPGEFRELRMQLDGWSIVALRRIELLERPVEVPVTVVATGDVTFTRVDTGERRNGARLEFRGERPGAAE